MISGVSSAATSTSTAASFSLTADAILHLHAAAIWQSSLRPLRHDLPVPDRASGQALPWHPTSAAHQPGLGALLDSLQDVEASPQSVHRYANTINSLCYFRESPEPFSVSSSASRTTSSLYALT